MLFPGSTLAALVLAVSAPLDASETALTARGVIAAAERADVAAPLSARLTAVPFRNGESFAKGAILARFDCGAMRAELAAVEDAQSTLRIKHQNQSELHAMGAAGELDLRLAASELAQAGSEADVIRTRLRDCTLRAPWPGRVEARHAQAHETPRAGEPILSVVRADALEIEIIAPASWLAWLRTGETLRFRLDDTGEDVFGRVSRLGATVDPVSQTVEVGATLSGTARTARPGMSGTAVFGLDRAEP